MHSFVRRFVVASVACALPVLAMACSASKTTGGPATLTSDAGDDASTTLFDGGGGGGGGGGGLVDDGGDSGGTNLGDAIGAPDTGTPVTTGTASIYGHSGTTLYRLDPTTLDVTSLGAFVDDDGNALTNVTDLAIDKSGDMFIVTFTDLYSVAYEGSAPTCTHLASLGEEFNGLTFVPAGMIDPSDEVLIGVSNAGDWYRIDVVVGATSATLTQLGSYGDSWMSSGDAVGIIGDAVYATVTNGTDSDHVVTVDPMTGKVLKDIGATGVSGLWGVGYWGGVMYGFASDGSLYSINLSTAAATSIPITNQPADGWWGAGVTTSAPTVGVH